MREKGWKRDGERQRTLSEETDAGWLRSVLELVLDDLEGETTWGCSSRWWGSVLTDDEGVKASESPPSVSSLLLTSVARVTSTTGHSMTLSCLEKVKVSTWLVPATHSCCDSEQKRMNWMTNGSSSLRHTLSDTVSNTLAVFSLYRICIDTVKKHRTFHIIYNYRLLFIVFTLRHDECGFAVNSHDEASQNFTEPSACLKHKNQRWTFFLQCT